MSVWYFSSFVLKLQCIIFLKGADAEPQPQQGRFGMFFSVVKTLIVRSLIIYFITSMFKKPATVPTDGVVPAADLVPNVNFFEYGTNFVSTFQFNFTKII